MIGSKEQIQNEIESFCTNILALRKKYNLTQRQMARKLHIGVLSLRRLEHGTIPPRMTVEVLYYINMEFRIGADQMFQENSITQGR